MKKLTKQLIELRDDLNKEIILCNAYLRKRGDVGKLGRKDDPLETISYTRGQSIGLIIARDKINKLLEQ